MSHFHSEECLCGTVGYGACDIPPKRRSVTGRTEILHRFAVQNDKPVRICHSERSEESPADQNMETQRTGGNARP